MNARFARKGLKMFNKAQIAEALNLVLEVDEDETPRVAFFGYAGHTKGLRIDIYTGGWKYGKRNKCINYLAYADNDICEKTDANNNKTRFATFDQMLEDARKAGL